MKPYALAINVLLMSLMTAVPAFAASSTRVYNSGVLVLVFLGFCALVVLVQLIPALITLWGMIKGAGEEKAEEVTVETK